MPNIVDDDDEVLLPDDFVDDSDDLSAPEPAKDETESKPESPETGTESEVAKASDDEEALVLTKKDLADLPPTLGDQSRLRIGGRDLSAKKARRWQGDVGSDVEIGDFFHGQGVASKRQKPPWRKLGGGGREFSGTTSGSSESPHASVEIGPSALYTQIHERDHSHL